MIGMYALVLESTQQELDRVKYEEDLAEVCGRDVPTPTGRHAIRATEAKLDEPEPKSDNDYEHPMYRAIQFRLDTLTDIALANDGKFGSFLATGDNSIEDTLRVSTYACLERQFTPTLVLRGKDGMEDRPLWYIQHKVDRKAIFQEDSGFAQDTVIKRLNSFMQMFTETMDLMPVAVALRHENGQYLHCNSNWAAQFQKTPEDLIGKFDSTEVNHEWRRHRLKALSQKEGLYQHTDIWVVQGQQFEYEVTEVRVANTQDGWRVLMSIGKEIRPYGEQGQLPTVTSGWDKKPKAGLSRIVQPLSQDQRVKRLEEENSALRAQLEDLLSRSAMKKDLDLDNDQ